MDPYMQNYYNERSHIDKALLNWNGSIYWVQGMQDWNVDPHQVFGGPPGTNWYQTYVDAGFEVRGILGQWGHHYPDQVNSHEGVDPGYGFEALENMTRWDWGQDLFEWFEYYLQEGSEAESGCSNTEERRPVENRGDMATCRQGALHAGSERLR